MKKNLIQFIVILLLVGCKPGPKERAVANQANDSSASFKGTINVDIRDSKPDWDAFLTKKAPKDAPNVLLILYDDTGCGAWSTYGGRINMPTLDSLAAEGLT